MDLSTEQQMKAISDGVEKALSKALTYEKSFSSSTFYKPDILNTIRSGVSDAMTKFLNENKSEILKAVEK